MASENGDVRKTLPDFQNQTSSQEQSSTFDDIYALYINDPGDHDLLDEEEDMMDV
ncbi:hypothetical protein PISMIDRAFT_15236 [Pisolithus microcarpus 441]|uniref:Unplaced genomic scaffold scaffold_149, whole genome shotgun sequence n=1 Tax=Pisolithus microcarpus 441 TaxID=765257 RepID=A0A0C9XXP9_9AGAM|nr:hypothetical protein BKA83DRAFT_15236 [Pisolithus microcarpus]KIK17280.1 hypothetical protein PISMIDRAFT_15236 [Pisolithus microcarpus 441]